MGNTKALDFISKWGILLATGTLIAVFSIMLPTFLTVPNIVTIVRAVSIGTIIAIGMTISLTVKGLDLSVGSTATLANTICMSFFIWFHMSNIPGGIVFAIGLTIVLCLGVAIINAFLIVVMKIPDMLAALSTMFMIEGVAMTYAGGGAITTNMIRRDGSVADGTVPAAFRAMGSEPWIIIIMLIVVLLTFLFLTYTKHGRYMYAVGDNSEAAKLSGINVKKYRTLAYILCAILASIGGILIGARVGNAQIDSGGPHLMGAVAAAHIGISVGGSGKPNALGTLVGAILIGVLQNGLIMAAVPHFAVNIFQGSILAAALALNYMRTKS